MTCKIISAIVVYHSYYYCHYYLRYSPFNFSLVLRKDRRMGGEKLKLGRGGNEVEKDEQRENKDVIKEEKKNDKGY